MSLTRKLIRTDGVSLDIPAGMSMKWLSDRIGAAVIDTVPLRHMGNPLHVMLVDDLGYEVDTVHADGITELRQILARKPVNAEATRLYHLNCRPGTTHQIVGDVVIVPDEDFA